MNPVSIQNFNHAQEKMKNIVMCIPFVAVAHAIAHIALSLAQIVHGLAMSAFYAIKERHSEGRANRHNKFLKIQYLASAKDGAKGLGLASVNLVTLGILFFGLALNEYYKEKAKTQAQAENAYHASKA
jgi:hypothetical protein